MRVRHEMPIFRGADLMGAHAVPRSKGVGERDARPALRQRSAADHGRVAAAYSVGASCSRPERPMTNAPCRAHAESPRRPA